MKSISFSLICSAYCTTDQNKLIYNLQNVDKFIIDSSGNEFRTTYKLTKQKKERHCRSFFTQLTLDKVICQSSTELIEQVHPYRY